MRMQRWINALRLRSARHHIFVLKVEKRFYSLRAQSAAQRDKIRCIGLFTLCF